MVAANETTATTATGATGGSVTTVSNEEKEFVVQAGEGGLAEVRQSEVARQKATNDEVKAFAERMVADHGKANEELQQLATNKGLVVPTALNEQHQKAVEHLQGLSGREFDRAYMMHMVEDHQKVVALFENAEKTAQDAELKAWISGKLPTLREHLQHAQKTQAAVQ
jgi:putative membrane protein